MMTWLHENKQFWRINFLILLALAFTGPWWFDRIYVPAPYICSAPNIRLDESFCGLPLSITWFYSTIIGELGYLATGMDTNALRFDDAARQVLFTAWITLLLLPLLTTILVLLRGDHRSSYLFHKVGLGLAGSLAMLIGIFDFSRAKWALWGLWLYIGLTLSMLLFEIWVFKINWRPAYE
jgi:hypothetical protein